LRLERPGLIVGSTSVTERERGGETEEMEVGGRDEELGYWCWRRNRRNGVEEEAKSWVAGAGGRTDEIEWRRRRGARLLVLEAENQNGDGRKLKWENGKCKIGYLYLGFIRVF
jgi:hypothetical protein